MANELETNSIEHIPSRGCRESTKNNFFAQLNASLAFVACLYAGMTCKFIETRIVSNWTPIASSTADVFNTTSATMDTTTSSLRRDPVGFGIYSRESTFESSNQCYWYSENDIDTIFDNFFMASSVTITLAGFWGGATLLVHMFLFFYGHYGFMSEEVPRDSDTHRDWKKIVLVHDRRLQQAIACSYICCALSSGLSIYFVYSSGICTMDRCNTLPDGTTGSLCFKTSACQIGAGASCALISSLLWLMGGIISFYNSCCCQHSVQSNEDRCPEDIEAYIQHQSRVGREDDKSINFDSNTTISTISYDEEEAAEFVNKFGAHGLEPPSIDYELERDAIDHTPCTIDTEITKKDTISSSREEIKPSSYAQHEIEDKKVEKLSDLIPNIDSSHIDEDEEVPEISESSRMGPKNTNTSARPTNERVCHDSNSISIGTEVIKEHALKITEKSNKGITISRTLSFDENDSKVNGGIGGNGQVLIHSRLESPDIPAKDKAGKSDMMDTVSLADTSMQNDICNEVLMAGATLFCCDDEARAHHMKKNASCISENGNVDKSIDSDSNISSSSMDEIADSSEGTSVYVHSAYDKHNVSMDENVQEELVIAETLSFDEDDSKLNGGTRKKADIVSVSDSLNMLLDEEELHTHENVQEEIIITETLSFDEDDSRVNGGTRKKADIVSVSDSLDMLLDGEGLCEI